MRASKNGVIRLATLTNSSEKTSRQKEVADDDMLLMRTAMSLSALNATVIMDPKCLYSGTIRRST